MKSHILDFKILKEEITPDNVLAVSELIAFTETRYLIGYMGRRMQKLYADLYSDIKNKHNKNHVFSDGYDLVQEGALYLCEHYGKHLNDVIGYTKKGKKITVRIACVRKMVKLITRKWSDSYRCLSAEHLTPKDEPSVEVKEETQQDYIPPLKYETVRAFLYYFANKEYKSDEEKNEFFNSFIYRVVLFDDYIYIFYNTSPEYPTKVKLEKEELNALHELSHPKAEKDAENKESTPFEPLKFKLGACGGR